MNSIKIPSRRSTYVTCSPLLHPFFTMGDCGLASILTFIAGIIMGTGSTLTIKVCLPMHLHGDHTPFHFQGIRQYPFSYPTCCQPTRGSLSTRFITPFLLPEQIAYETNSTGLDGKVKVFGTCPPPRHATAAASCSSHHHPSPYIIVLPLSPTHPHPTSLLPQKSPLRPRG